MGTIRQVTTGMLSSHFAVSLRQCVPANRLNQGNILSFKRRPSIIMARRFERAAVGTYGNFRFSDPRGIVPVCKGDSKK